MNPLFKPRRAPCQLTRTHLQRTSDFAFGIAFRHRLALIVQLLATGKRDFKLHQAVCREVNSNGNNCQSRLARFLLQIANLLAMKQQLALAVGVGIVLIVM